VSGSARGQGGAAQLLYLAQSPDGPTRVAVRRPAWMVSFPPSVEFAATTTRSPPSRTTGLGGADRSGRAMGDGVAEDMSAGRGEQVGGRALGLDQLGAVEGGAVDGGGDG